MDKGKLKQNLENAIPQIGPHHSYYKILLVFYHVQDQQPIIYLHSQHMYRDFTFHILSQQWHKGLIYSITLNKILWNTRYNMVEISSHSVQDISTFLISNSLDRYHWKKQTCTQIQKIHRIKQLMFSMSQLRIEAQKNKWGYQLQEAARECKQF